MIELSYSQVAMFMSCPMKHYWGYQKRIEPVKTPVPFLTGRAVHDCAERIHQGLSTDGVVDQTFDEALSDIRDEEDRQRLELERAKAHGMVGGYKGRYGDEHKGWDQALAEKEFKIPICDGVSYVGKIDLLFRKGDVWTLREMKTAARPDRDYFARLPLDWQLLGYIYAAKENLGISISRVEYDVIVKPAIRLKVRESVRTFAARCAAEYTAKKDMLLRHEVPVDHRQVQFWRKQIAHVGQLLVDAKENNRYHQNPEACINKYGGCVFMDACVTRRINPLIYREKGERR